MFLTFPTYDRYRNLRLLAPAMRGEDVFALQTALNYLDFDCGRQDGVFGAMTKAATLALQKSSGITTDGIVGGGTQQKIAERLTNEARAKYTLPLGLVYGQVMHESGCRLGNYSPQRPDGSFDAGVAQLNSAHTDPEQGFTVPYAVDRLGKLLRASYDEFVGITDRHRRWELATGCWNGPAYAKYIAREEGATRVPRNETARPSQNARILIEEYMKSATAFLEL